MVRSLRAVLASFALLLAGVAVLPDPVGAAVPTPNPSVGTIVNGIAWNDTNNRYIAAHLGSSFQVRQPDGSTLFYWCGVNWDEPDTGHTFRGVQCYSSPNLSTWTSTGTALAVDNSNALLSSSRIIERPKVVYNATTHKYVMWFHDDSTSYNQNYAGVAVSDSPTGPYAWVPDTATDRNRNCGIAGSRTAGTLDMTLYQDSSGAAYFVHTTAGNADVVIQRLSDGYLTCSATVATGLGGGREAPQLVKANGVYFLFTSATNWWAPSQGTYRTSTNMTTWSAPTTFGSGVTAGSQGDDIIPVTGSVGTTYVMMADRLQGSAGGDVHWNVNQSQYVWLPLTFRGTSMRMDYVANFSVDTRTGLWSSTDPQPCDLTQLVDNEYGAPNNIGSTSAGDLVPGTAAGWSTTSSVQPTGNLTNRVYTYSGLSSFASEASDPTQYTNYYVQAFAKRSAFGTDNRFNSQVAVAGRFDQASKNRYYALTLSGIDWRLTLNNGGAPVKLAGGAGYPGMSTADTWYLMRLVMQGQQLSAWVSIDRGRTFTKLGSALDSTLTSGSFAIQSARGTNSFDNITTCVLGTRSTPNVPVPAGFGTNSALVSSADATCASVAGVANGAPVASAGCAQASDRWTWEQFPENAGGSGRVVHGAGRCLDAANASAVPGAAVAVGDCYSGGLSASQRWKYADQGNGTFVLVNAASPAGANLCLTAASADTSATLQPCTGAANQLWRAQQ